MEMFFCPDSVAVIGVSSSITNLASRILSNLKLFRFSGKIYAVGPREEEVEGFPVMDSVRDLPEGIDLAVLLVPARQIPDIAEECGKKGIKNLIVESGGFREFEGKGSDVEERLLEVCKRYGIRFIGPNCIGTINTKNGLCSAFFGFSCPLQPGDISVLAQSGGVGISYATDLSGELVGINKFASYGNGLDTDEVDLIEYLGRDKSTRIISAYIEGIERGREFMRVVSRLEKPIVVLKSNTQPMANPIAASHSAALSGDERVLDAAFRQAGVLRVPNSLIWTNVSKQLQMPLMKGNRLAILSRSGGHAVLATDAAAKIGFDLPEFPPSFFEAVSQYFENSVIHLQNPLDLGQIFFHPVLSHILEETLKLDEVDGILFVHMYTRAHDSDLARMVISQIPALMEKYGKPISTVLFTQRDERQYIRENYKLPLFRSPWHAVQAMGYSRDAWLALKNRRPFEARPLKPDNEAARVVLGAALAEKRNPTLEEALDLVEASGIRRAKHVAVSSREELAAAGEKLGYPVVLKIVHDQASHKTEVGGVEMNCRDAEDLENAWDRMTDSLLKKEISGGLQRAIVQKMAPSGWEFLVGGRRDPNFGPVVLAGFGGTLAEAVDDVGVRVAPLTEKDVQHLLRDTKASRLLDGFRGRPPADRDALQNLILKISRLMVEVEDVEELDLNPVIVHEAGKGLTVVDARVILKNR